MHKSKLLALLLVVAMVVSMIVMPAYAAEEKAVFELKANKTAVLPGQTVTLTLSVTNNPSFNQATTGVTCSADGWTYADRNVNLYTNTLKYADGTILATPYDADAAAAPYTVSYVTVPGSNTSRAQMTGVGALWSLTLTAPETAGKYTFTPTVTDIKDVDGNVIPVEAAPITITVGCPTCGAETGTWTEVNASNVATLWPSNVIPTGHYKLTGNLTITGGALNVTTSGGICATAFQVKAEAKVCIDLNGHDITATSNKDGNGYPTTGSRVFDITGKGELTILDSTATGAGENYTAGTISGGVALGNGWINGGNIRVDQGTLNLYSGIIADGFAGVPAYQGTQTRGGNIYGTQYSIIEIYGGQIKNGSVARWDKRADKAYTTGGGNIASEGIVNIYDGEIFGGYLRDNLSASISQMHIYGGNIMMVGSATRLSHLKITGGLIHDGVIDLKASSTYTGTSYMSVKGGNIFGTYADIKISGADTKIYNGKVEAHKATGAAGNWSITANGGNIAVADSSTLVITDASVTGGVLNSDNGSVAAGQDTNYGGNIYGETGAVITLDGTARVYGGKSDRFGGNIGITGATLNLKGHSTVESGWIYDVETAKYITNYLGGGDNIYAYGANTVVNMYDEARLVVATENCNTSAFKRNMWLRSGDAATPAVLNLYGGNAGYTRFEKANATLYNGSVYVEKSTATITVASCATQETTNKADSYRVHQKALDKDNKCATCDVTYSKNGLASATDCGHDDVVWTLWDGITIASGHYYLASDMTLGKELVVGDGVNFCLDMNGKTLKAATFAGRREFSVNAGGNLVIVGNGTLQGSGLAVDGNAGMVYAHGGNLTMKGITVNGGVAGTVGGTNRIGGNIAADNGSVVNLENCTITNGTCNYRGANLGFQGGANVTLTNCNVSGAYFVDEQQPRGGNLFVNANNTYVTIDGGNYDASSVDQAYYGGNIYVTGHTVGTTEGHQLTVKGGAVISGGVAEIGGNISLVYGSASLENCQVTGGKATQGSNVCVRVSSGRPSVLEVKDGAVISGGNNTDVYVDTDCQLNVAASGAQVGVVDLYGTLNLNGFNLEADEIDATTSTASITDTVGGGKLTCAELSVHESNSYLPIDHDGGYYFQQVELKKKFEDLGDGKAKLKFAIKDLGADATYLDDSIKAGKDVKVQVTVAWIDQETGDPTAEHFVYGQDLVDQYVENWGSLAFTCVISGLENLPADYTITGEIVSNGVVTAVSAN